jgi:predicted HAD superfamily phosphohydrolase YqeG
MTELTATTQIKEKSDKQTAGTKCLLLDFDNTLFNTDSRRDIFGHWLPGFPEASIPGYKLYDGWREVLSWAQENNVKTAIISTTTENHIKKALEHFGLKVDAIYGRVRKNSGKVLLNAISNLGGTASDTLYVGDHAKDAEIARMASVPFAAALWDSWHEAQLAARNCLTISSPSEIINLFTHLSDIPKPIRVPKEDDPGCSKPTGRK